MKWTPDEIQRQIESFRARTDTMEELLETLQKSDDCLQGIYGGAAPGVIQQTKGHRVKRICSKAYCGLRVYFKGGVFERAVKRTKLYKRIADSDLLYKLGTKFWG